MMQSDARKPSGFDRDILEWNVPEEVLAVLLKDPNCHTLCDKLSWSHYRLPDIAKLEK